MSVNIDRPGIFKAKPFSWRVYNAESGAVAVNIGFEILAQFAQDNSWDDWSEYETHHCYGNWWVVKRDGTINQPTVEQLASCLGWGGNLKTVTSHVPDVVVQITVKEEVYNGQARFKATWMNPEDYVPTGGGASEEEVDQLQARFGSLLRAAAAGSATQAPTTPKIPPPADEGPPLTDDDIPF